MIAFVVSVIVNTAALLWAVRSMFGTLAHYDPLLASSSLSYASASSVS
jgi:hypothetical protein